MGVSHLFFENRIFIYLINRVFLETLATSGVDQFSFSICNNTRI